QVEEQLALRLGGRNLDNAPVAQDVFVDLGADPVHGEGNQAHADIRIEALDGLHQADIAFLHQVGQWQAVTGVAARNVHDETQVGQNQFLCRGDVLLVTQATGQRLLFVHIQHRYAGDCLQI